MKLFNHKKDKNSKIFLYIYCFFLSGTLHVLPVSPVNKIVDHVYKALRNCDIRQTKKYAQLLIQEFINNKNLSQKEVSISLEALHETGNYRLLTNNIDMLSIATQNFLHVSGFRERLAYLFMNIESELLTKGLLYELEKAVQIIDDNKHVDPGQCQKIESFNQKITIKDEAGCNITREFDIITRNAFGDQKCFIECKNINWSFMSIDTNKNNIYKHKQQFLEQRYIVYCLNKLHATRHSYKVSSKQSIPVSWKNWLTSQSICYEDDSFK